MFLLHGGDDGPDVARELLRDPDADPLEDFDDLGGAIADAAERQEADAFYADFDDGDDR